MATVNGYACANCADEARAKRHIDPHQSDAALELEARSARERLRPQLGVNAPQPGAASGSRLNVYA